MFSLCCCSGDVTDGTGPLVVTTTAALASSQSDVAKPHYFSTGSSSSARADGSTQPASDVLHSWSTISANKADRVKEFVARIQVSPGDGLGASIEVSDGHYVRIAKIDEVGAIAEYNKEASSELRIQDGDFIVAIDCEVEGDTASIRSAIQEGGEVDFIIRPPCHLCVSMTKSDDRFWGLHLGSYAAGTSMFIKDMLPDGAVDEYNRVAPEDYKLMLGDIVLVLNGASGNPTAMQRALKGDSGLELALVRPCAM